jgi:hypothetical protein
MSCDPLETIPVMAALDGVAMVALLVEVLERLLVLVTVRVTVYVPGDA